MFFCLHIQRRAHLRHCFDELRRVVPLARDSSRHTTLGLLRRARHVIKVAISMGLAGRLFLLFLK